MFPAFAACSAFVASSSNVFSFVSLDGLFCYLDGLCILFLNIFSALVLLVLTFAFIFFLSFAFLSLCCL